MTFPVAYVWHVQCPLLTLSCRSMAQPPWIRAATVSLFPTMAARCRAVWSPGPGPGDDDTWTSACTLITPDAHIHAHRITYLFKYTVRVHEHKQIQVTQTTINTSDSVMLLVISSHSCPSSDDWLHTVSYMWICHHILDNAAGQWAGHSAPNGRPIQFIFPIQLRKVQRLQFFLWTSFTVCDVDEYMHPYWHCTVFTPGVEPLFLPSWKNKCQVLSVTCAPRCMLLARSPNTADLNSYTDCPPPVMLSIWPKWQRISCQCCSVWAQIMFHATIKP